MLMRRWPKIQEGSRNDFGLRLTCLANFGQSAAAGAVYGRSSAEVKQEDANHEGVTAPWSS
jgi:hypothetical protein